MSKFFSVVIVWAFAGFGLIENAVAQAVWVEQTGAKDCLSCHLSISGGGARIPAADAAYDSGGVPGLAEYIRSLNNNTKPKLNSVNPEWNVTVGELPLKIPLQVSDAENDPFTITGTIPLTNYTLSDVRIDNKTNLPTIDLQWTPTAAFANKSIKLSLYAKETVEQPLSSNTVSTTIHVWPARTSNTKLVSQFILQGAAWRSNKLALTGQLFFKAGVSAAERAAALKVLQMNILSKNGFVITDPVMLSPDSNGKWSKTLTLTAGETPCIVKLGYEGFNAIRSVNPAPPACIP